MKGKIKTSPFQTLSLNAYRKNPILHSVLSEADEASLDIILVQEPWWDNIGNGVEGAPSHPGWDTIPPEAAPTRRPRVLAYVKKRPDLEVTLRSDLASDPDLQVLEVRQRPHQPFLIINIYNK